MTTSPAEYAPVFPTLPQSSHLFAKQCDGVPSAHNASLLHESRGITLSASILWQTWQIYDFDAPKGAILHDIRTAISSMHCNVPGMLTVDVPFDMLSGHTLRHAMCRHAVQMI